MFSNHPGLSSNESESAPEPSAKVCEKESVEAHVGVYAFRYVLFLFLAYICGAV